MVMVFAIVLVTPFMFGVVRLARGIGVAIALSALPAADQGQVDLAAAPRRALVVTLQLGVIVLVCLPILAATQPFLPRWSAVVSVGLLLPVLGVVLWRSASDLQGHVKAGAELIVEALVAHARKDTTAPGDAALEQIRRMMPGLGEPVPLRLDERCPAVGRTLAELNLRGLTGTSVLAVVRGEQGVIFPLPNEVLRKGDVLALAGTRESIAAAKEVLEGAAPSSGSLPPKADKP